jgi:hypothetical protein
MISLKHMNLIGTIVLISVVSNVLFSTSSIVCFESDEEIAANNEQAQHVVADVNEYIKDPVLVQKIQRISQELDRVKQGLEKKKSSRRRYHASKWDIGFGKRAYSSVS